MGKSFRNHPLQRSGNVRASIRNRIRESFDYILPDGDEPPSMLEYNSLHANLKIAVEKKFQSSDGKFIQAQCEHAFDLLGLWAEAFRQRPVQKGFIAEQANRNMNHPGQLKTAKFYALLSLFSFVAALLSIGLLTWQLPRLRQYGSEVVTVACYGILGVCLAFAVFGAMRSYGRIKGGGLGAKWEFGGPAALVVFLLSFGMYFESNDKRSTFNLVLHFYSKGVTREIIDGDGQVTLILRTPQAPTPIVKGIAFVGEIPIRWKGQSVDFRVDINGFRKIPESKVTLLADQNVEVDLEPLQAVKDDPRPPSMPPPTNSISKTVSFNRRETENQTNSSAIDRVLAVLYGGNPPATRDEVQPILRLGLFARKGEERVFGVISEPTVSLRSLFDEYFIAAIASSKGFLYVFQVDGTGRLFWLFPRNSCGWSSGSNPVSAYDHVHIPSVESDEAFVLDTTTGLEKIYVVFCPTDWDELRAALERESKPAPGLSKQGTSSATARGPGALVTMDKNVETAWIWTNLSEATASSPNTGSVEINQEIVARRGDAIIVRRQFQHRP
jgi:hypothetical protein